MVKLIRNRAQCRNCGDTIESVHRHDYQTCSCYRTSVMAREKFVAEYQARLRRELGDDNQAFYEHMDYEAMYKEMDKECPARGIMVDGGTDYQRRSIGNDDFIDLSEWEEDGGTGI